jgi:type IV secretion system protein TrbL
MGNTGVIDSFLGVFTSYIDSGFGLLGGEVAFIATTLIVIDVTLAALFWAWGADDDIIARLVKKTLFVGVFAYIISNWNNLARIVFESFAGLGLMASGTAFSVTDLMRPGRVAQTGLDAGRPLLDSISDLMGWIAFFENFIQIACLLFAWALVVLAFFILAIQLFVTLIEFKLTTLAGLSFRPASRFWFSPSSSASAAPCFRSSLPVSAGRPRLSTTLWRLCSQLCRCSVSASSVPASPTASSPAVRSSAQARP